MPSLSRPFFYKLGHIRDRRVLFSITVTAAVSIGSYYAIPGFGNETLASNLWFKMPPTEGGLVHQLAELLENFPQIVRVIFDDLQTLIRERWLRLR
jgi:hypothetical protein